jgi:DNA-binding Lrp family transcriptional regulator
MDRLDVQILSILQKDSQISMAQLSDKVGLSLSACHRRVKILEADGKISHYAAQIDRQVVGLHIQVFIEIKLKSNRRADYDAFEAAIAQIDDVLECHVISGEFDYLIRVAAPDSGSYENIFMDRLANIPSVLHTKTMLSLRTAKEFRGYNLEGVEG